MSTEPCERSVRVAPPPRRETVQALAAWALALDALAELEYRLAIHDWDATREVTRVAVSRLQEAGAHPVPADDSTDVAKALRLILKEVLALSDRLHPWLTDPETPPP
jgi:hypothetical protein